MPQHLDWMLHSLGQLQASVTGGFAELHRRIDHNEETAAEWRRHFSTELRHLDRRMDRKKNGSNGHTPIPYAKIATFLGLVTVGTLTHVAPDAVRAAILDSLKSMLHIGAG